MSSRDLVAFLQNGRVLLHAGDLPTVFTDGDPAGTREVLAHVGADYLIGPPRRLGPGSTLHTVAAHDPPPAEAEERAGEPGRTGPEADWVPYAQVPGDPAVRAAITRAVREHDGSSPAPARRPRWYRRGWVDEVRAWVDASLTGCGRRRTGPLLVERMWSLSAVLCAPTERGVVYVKATSGHFHAEPAITGVLAGLCPDAVPTVLAVDPDRAWMLLDRLAGVDAERADGAGPAAAGVLAEVQLRGLDQLAPLRAAGCPDRTRQPTLDAFRRLIEDSVELADLTAAEISAARQAAPRLSEAVEELWDCGLPATLTHGDLHIGNTAYDGTRVRLFDWTDASISHPFTDGAHLARSVLWEKSGGGSRETMDRAVAEAFAAPWRARYPRADVDRALALALVVDQVFQAISYEGIYRSQEDASRWELAGMVARFLRRLPDLADEAAYRAEPA